MIQVVNCLITFLLCTVTATYGGVKVCAVGDIIFDENVKTLSITHGFNYTTLNVQKVIKEHDIAFFNLESPITENCKGSKLNKKYSFHAESIYAKSLSDAGFNIASVANNHTIDCGKEGLISTIQNLENNSIKSSGGGKNQDEAFKPVIIERGGQKFAFFSILEFLLEGVSFNKDKPYPAFGNINKLCNEISSVRSNVDNIIVSFHWGNENSYKITSRQKEFAHRVIDAGADLVLGHHPHVIQPIEVYSGKLILYSLGNFISSHKKKKQKQSFILSCDFSSGSVSNVKLIPIMVENCQPAIAKNKHAKDIYNLLKTITVNTSLYKYEKGLIHVTKDVYPSAIKHIYRDNCIVKVYPNKFILCHSGNSFDGHNCLPKGYKFLDMDYYERDSVYYIFSIVEDVHTKKRKLASFIYYLIIKKLSDYGMDIHDDFYPWKLVVSNIDNDSSYELIVGVNKASRYYKDVNKRIFVYNTNKNNFYPKWLGSKIGRKVEDFYVSHSKLIVKHDLQNVKDTTVYKWKGFGFAEE